MSFFKKPKPTKVVDDTVTIVTDFMLRPQFASYRPIPYYEYGPFVNYTPVIDSYLEELFKGELDENNDNMIDNIICDMARQAEKDLDKQRTEHGDTIMSFEIRKKGDIKAFLHERALLQAEIEDDEQQLAEIKTRLKKDKFVGGKQYA